ncbi:PLD nuclease N-terminal domain-containing protein [Terrabacter sp. NPDC080008]|uniref:PLD nuclease N-terminal domain-containing protein n=1 Tax=Terrabacter sp. NPDC080008 TaxID=3155176 RepID=UPI00344B8EC0
MAAKRRRQKWSDLSRGQQAAVLVTGTVQLSLAAAAWIDLARRPAEQVEGSKAKWAAIIAINWVGPLTYFARGRKGSGSGASVADSTPAEHSLEP